MQRSAQYATWLEIDLSAIESNVRLVRQLVGVAVMAVVKADGYGHGAVQTARAALRGGASWCAVARIEEALELRNAGVDCPLLLLGYTPAGVLEQAIARDVSLTVWDSQGVQAASAAARRVGRSARLHLKVDTGMSRLGVQPDQALPLVQEIVNQPNVNFEGLFTHFARADEAQSSASDAQETLFLDLLAKLERAGLRPPLVHTANSAASLFRPGAAFDLVRPGIVIYGLEASPTQPLPPGFRPALAWKAVLSQVKVLPPGRGVSYGHEYVTTAYERIGTVPLGYADGIRWGRPNEVLVAGRRVPVVGRVCMDQLMVQLDAVPEARPGDEVVLIGSQGQERISAEDVARRWGTINYEVVVGIGRRVPRLYHWQGKSSPEALPGETSCGKQVGKG